MDSQADDEEGSEWLKQVEPNQAQIKTMLTVPTVFLLAKKLPAERYARRAMAHGNSSCQRPRSRLRSAIESANRLTVSKLAEEELRRASPAPDIGPKEAIS